MKCYGGKLRQGCKTEVVGFAGNEDNKKLETLIKYQTFPPIPGLQPMTRRDTVTCTSCNLFFR